MSLCIGVAKNDNERRTLLKRRVRSLVKEGLRKSDIFGVLLFTLSTENITKNSTVDMSWQNYEENIVDRYGVILDGWPVTQFNPGQMSTRLLQTVLNALDDGTCSWRTLEEQELQDRQADRRAKKASGEITIMARKRRSDAGKARGAYKRKRKGEVEASYSAESGGESGEGEDVEEGRDFQRASKKRRQAVSSAIIADSD